MMTPITATWLNVLLVGLVFGFAFTIGAFVANALLNVARSGKTP